MDYHRTMGSTGPLAFNANRRNGGGGGRGGVLANLAAHNQDATGGAPQSSYPTLDTAVTPGWFAFTGGNLTVTATGAGAAHSGYTRATGSGKSTGKWYWECVLNNKNADNYDTGGVGMVSSTFQQGTAFGLNAAANEKSLYYCWNGLAGKYDTTLANDGYKTVHSVGGVISLAVDVGGKKVWVGYNGTWQDGGNPSTDTTPTFLIATASTWWPAILLDEGPATSPRPSYTIRFDPSTFSYAIPTGFSAYA